MKTVPLVIGSMPITKKNTTTGYSIYFKKDTLVYVDDDHYFKYTFSTTNLYLEFYERDNLLYRSTQDYSQNSNYSYTDMGMGIVGLYSGANRNNRVMGLQAVGCVRENRSSSTTYYICVNLVIYFIINNNKMEVLGYYNAGSTSSSYPTVANVIDDEHVDYDGEKLQWVNTLTSQTVNIRKCSKGKLSRTYVQYAGSYLSYENEIGVTVPITPSSANAIWLFRHFVISSSGTQVNILNYKTNESKTFNGSVKTMVEFNNVLLIYSSLNERFALYNDTIYSSVAFKENVIGIDFPLIYSILPNKDEYVLHVYDLETRKTASHSISIAVNSNYILDYTGITPFYFGNIIKESIPTEDGFFYLKTKSFIPIVLLDVDDHYNDNYNKNQYGLNPIAADYRNNYSGNSWYHMAPTIEAYKTLYGRYYSFRF